MRDEDESYNGLPPTDAKEWRYLRRAADRAEILWKAFGWMATILLDWKKVSGVLAVIGILNSSKLMAAVDKFFGLLP